MAIVRLQKMVLCFTSRQLFMLVYHCRVTSQLMC